MTIKQQGGIFGRNPTFNDLTVEGTVSVPNNSISGNAIDGGSADLDGLTVNGDFEVSSNIPKITFTEEDDATRTELTQNFGYFTINADAGDQQAGDGIIFKVDNAEAARFNSDLNLAFPSGQGIDFSATAGTGTSELLDDYEEGTWTPTVVGLTSGSASYTLSAATYTKTGRQVTVFAYLTSILLGSDDIVGSMVIGGLPFSNGTSNLQGVSITYQNISTAYTVISGRALGTVIRLQQNSTTSALARTDCVTSNGTIMISATYNA